MKIKEVEKRLSMSSHTLRYYEKMNLIHPQRDKNGYRDYSVEDVEKLKKIYFLRKLEIPIEDIVAIMQETTSFQAVLDRHIQQLDQQIASLQYVQQICREYQEKNIPVLDAFIQDRQIQHVDQKLLRDGLKKLADYLHSKHTVIIGRRIQVADYYTGLFVMIMIAIALGFVFGNILPEIITKINAQYHMSMLIWYQSGFSMMVIMTCISLLIILGLYHLAVTKQNYIELTDEDIQICSRQFQSRYSILLGLILKQSHFRNQHYQWQQLKNVHVDIVISTMTQRYGFSKIYLPRFTFTFLDGQVYSITSGLSFDEDSQMAYEIIKAKHIDVSGEDHVIGFYQQKQQSGFEYFEQYYGYNTPSKK